MFDIQGKLLALLLGLAIGALPTWYLTSKYKNSVMTAALVAQENEAAAALQTATEVAILKERANAKKAQQLDIEHAATLRKLSQAARDNRRLIADAGGLHDPAGVPGGGCPATPTPAPAGGAPQPPTGCKLSARVTEDLQRLAERADEAATWAGTCYRWIQSREGQ